VAEKVHGNHDQFAFKVAYRFTFVASVWQDSNGVFPGACSPVRALPWPDLYAVAQTRPSAKLEIGHDFWGFKDNAPQGTQAIARTSDGFLWFGTILGLYRFDGTRFELFHSPFGDQLRWSF
jgi:hypothetical protein